MPEMDVKQELDSQLTRIVCWTRMQSEAGQQIACIVARKELERRAGSGVFFWGVGNAPSRRTRALAIKREEIDVVFSLMKTRPKEEDVEPAGVLVWNSYFGADEVEYSLPRNVLVTSRMGASGTSKKNHYALMCHSEEELSLRDFGPFDPSAYRNVSEAGGAVGQSQVTALVVRTTGEIRPSEYRINFRARLGGGYWVKLAQPSAISKSARARLMAASAQVGDMGVEEWIEVVSEIRSNSPLRTKRRNPLIRTVG